MATAKFKTRSKSQISIQTTINKLPENILLEILSNLSMKDRCRSRRLQSELETKNQRTQKITKQLDEWGRKNDTHERFDQSLYQRTTSEKTETKRRAIVCQKWNQILSYDSLWRHVDLLEFRIGLKALWRLVRTRFSPRMSTLKLRGYNQIDKPPALGGIYKGEETLSDAVLKRIAARCPNLQVLHLHHCNTHKFSFESLPTSIVCLEMVHCVWKPRWMTDKQKHLPKLENLNLENSMFLYVQDSDMEDISVWRNLKYLSISYSRCVHNEGVITIANTLYELEYLNICSTRIDDDAVHHITLRLKKLSHLCLANCQEVTDNGVVQIATGLPVLQKLDISHCRRVTMRGLETLFGGTIRELIVVGLTQLSKKDKQALKRGFAVTRFR